MKLPYRIVTAKVKKVLPKSFFIESPNAAADVCIPRSLLTVIDDLKIEKLDPGSTGVEHTFRLQEWKAEEIGLA